MSSNKTAAALNKPVFDGDAAQAQLTNLAATSEQWIRAHWAQIAIAIAIGVVIAVVLRALRGLGTKLCNRDPGGNGWGTILGRAITRTGNFFIVMAAARLVVGYANAPDMLNRTVEFLWTVAATFQAAIWARELILGAVEHKTAAGHESLSTAMGLIRALVTFLLFAIALVVVLDNLGVNVTGLVAGLGIGGIAIGLAAQGIFADLFAAIAIIFDRPFRRGDAITYDKSSGTVEAIGLKSTRVRAATGEERIIANKKLLDQEILNTSQREYRRHTFTLGLVQWTPVDVMESLPDMLKEIVEGCGARFVRAGFVGFGDQSYDFELQFDSMSSVFQDLFDTRHTIGLAIIRKLNKEKIDLAYPTQTAFTASPKGGYIEPYPEADEEPRIDAPDEAAVAAPPKKPPSSGDRSNVDQ